MQNVFYTLLPCLQYEMGTCIYTAVVPKAKKNKTKKNTACFLKIMAIYKLQNVLQHGVQRILHVWPFLSVLASLN